MNNIKIKYNNEWVFANPDYNAIFIKYKTECEHYGIYELTFNNLTIYRTNKALCALILLSKKCFALL